MNESLGKPVNELWLSWAVLISDDLIERRFGACNDYADGEA